MNWKVFTDKCIVKFVESLLSIKVWMLALVSVLLCVGLLTGGQFLTGLGLIVGLREGFKIVRIIKNRDKEETL